MTAAEVIVDATGLRCPAPMLALAQAVRDAPEAASWLLLSDDPATRHDIPAWCRMTGLADLGPVSHEGVTGYRIGRPDPKASGTSSAASS